MFVVGLTGGIGSGKSAATSIFEELGIDVVDADLASREAVMPGSNALMKIHERFGDDILLEDKTLNRSKLREIIFDSSEEKIWLEQLLHPEIREIIQSKLKSSTSEYVILVSPLLFETDQYDFCDLTILIDTSESHKSQELRREMRDRRLCKKIIRLKCPEKIMKLANIVINNDNTLEDLKKNVERFINVFSTK